jgi:hypothetical protein
MRRSEFDAQMQHNYPAYEWGVPLPVSLIGGGAQHYCCRLCVAYEGLKGRDVESLPTDPAVVRKHINENHIIMRRQ